MNKIEIDTHNIPRHIAIIMDGNGRWANTKGLPRIAGHRKGVRTVRKITEICGKLDIRILTLYTFSAENWNVPFFLVRGEAPGKPFYIDIRSYKPLPSEQPECLLVNNMRAGTNKKIPKFY